MTRRVSIQTGGENRGRFNLASIGENRASCDEYFKSRLGNEWSKDWGSIDMRWCGALPLRIHSLFPQERYWSLLLERADGVSF
jgi:hypothetical protein